MNLSLFSCHQCVNVDCDPAYENYRRGLKKTPKQDQDERNINTFKNDGMISFSSCSRYLDNDVDPAYENYRIGLKQKSRPNPTKGDIQTAFQLPPRIAHQLQQLEQLFLPPELRKRNPTSPTKQNRQGLLPGFNPKGVLTSEEKEAFQNLNQQSLDHLLEMVGSQEWDYVTERQGVKVWKRFLPSFLKHNKEQIPLDGEEIAMAERAAKFAAVKAFGVIDAPVEEVYKLFLDNSRVSEYNDQCAQVADLEYVNENTKVTWACTPRYGPIKARDFCTVVHYRKLSDGTCVVVNRPTNHEQAKRSDEFVRSEILIAGNIMRPNADDPENKTDFYSVTHVNPGGICDSKPFAMVMNALCANAPVSFIRKLEVAANKDV